MIKIDNLKLNIPFDMNVLNNKVSAIIGEKITPQDIVILKRSIDSRKKSDIKYVLSVGVRVANQAKLLSRRKDLKVFELKVNTLESVLSGISPSKSHPIVIGSGPAGLFCGLALALKGLKPIIFERGADVDSRIKAVENFENKGILDVNCNVQFGEGGAGTFSDGKLNTGVSSEFISVVLNEFLNAGAPSEILFDNKPHIGTDKLVGVVKSIREKIISLGGEVHFNTTLSDIIIKGGKVCEIETVGESGGRYATDALVLAIGHSARDTFEMLLKSNINMTPKAFSVGVRVEHLQEQISQAQYGESFKKLPPADYKLATKLDNSRSCYTFCMCPGGYVMCASSEENAVVTNGMSRYARDGKNANSAVLVSVTPADYPSGNALAGVEFQRNLERKAFELGGMNYKAPATLFGDFEQGRISKAFGKVKPTYKIGTNFCDFRELLPDYISNGIIQGINIFGQKIRGFNNADTILEGVESRSSSPVRIERDASGQCNIAGIYPCGEGAGYAGGIMSAAVDGIKTAINVLTKLN